MKRVIILFLLTVSFLAGQGFNVSDTIYVVALQQFKVPARKQIVLTNIKKINDIKATLLDESGNAIKELTEHFQSPQQLKGGERGETVVYEVYGVTEKAGTYYVRIDLDFVDETRRRTQSGYYLLLVDNPNMPAKVSIRESYYPGEKETFSFATAEYTDPLKYSYEIQNSGGQVIDTGRGAVVNLDEVLKKDESLGQSYTVVGKYNGEEFQYKEAGTGELKETRWAFNVIPPKLSGFVTWKDLSNADEADEGGVYYISPFNKKLLTFYFIYTGYVEEDGSLVAAPAKLRNLQITSEPADFLMPGRGGNFAQSGYFTIVSLDLNQEFIDVLEIGDEVPVKIKMKFSTQFEKNVEYEYESTIIM